MCLPCTAKNPFSQRVHAGGRSCDRRPDEPHRSEGSDEPSRTGYAALVLTVTLIGPVVRSIPVPAIVTRA